MDSTCICKIGGTPTGYRSSSFIPGPVQPIPGNTLLPRFRIACAPSQSISAAGGDRNPIRRASSSRILLLMRRKLSKLISAKSSPSTNTSIMRTGLLSSMKSSRHSGNSVHCPRSACSTKRVVSSPQNHGRIITAAQRFHTARVKSGLRRIVRFWRKAAIPNAGCVRCGRATRSQ